MYRYFGEQDGDIVYGNSPHIFYIKFNKFEEFCALKPRLEWDKRWSYDDLNIYFRNREKRKFKKILQEEGIY